MSSSSRNAVLGAGIAAVFALAAMPVSALAADTYFTPTVSLQAENHSNRSLTPDNQPSKDLTGYTATLEAMVGARTPRSKTELKPRLRFQKYPDAKDLDQTEGSLDLRSTFSTQRTKAELVAKFSHTDEYNAEFVDDDDFDPDGPDVVGNGRILFSETRTRIEARPSIEFQLTERTGVGAELLFQDVSYDADGPTTQRDYRNYEGSVFLTRNLSQRTELEAGVVASRYETDNDANKTDSYGFSTTLRQRWSETFTADLSLRVEDSDIERGNPVSFKQSATDWSLFGGLAWRGQITRVRLSAGRSLNPSGDGDRVVRDEVRLAVDRDLSQRLVLKAVLRAAQQKAQGGGVATSDRDYARGELSLEWKAARTWFVRGGASYTWQDRKIEPDSAKNRSVFLVIGYRGLGPVPTRR